VYKARKLKDGQAAKSGNNHLCVLRKLLNLAVEWGELSHAPRVKQLRVAHGDFQFLSFEETPRFLRAAAPEWKAFVRIALKTGLRVGELLALRWEDLDLVTGRHVVRRTLWRDQEDTPKGGRTREVPLSDDAIATLKAHRHLKGPYVFCERDGARLTHSRVKDVVPWMCSKAGLAKRLTTHDLRHTLASHLVMRGVALKSVQELLAPPCARAPGGARHDRHDDALRAPLAGREAGCGEIAGRPGATDPLTPTLPPAGAGAEGDPAVMP
jgi:integrase